MKPILEKISHTSQHSFVVKEDILDYISIPWHFHPEIELTCIVQGTGKRVIGDSVESFSNNDLLLLGSNLPHFMRNDPAYYAKNSKLKVKAIVVHFMRDCFGDTFFDLPEMTSIRALLERSKRGVHFYGSTSIKIKALMQKLPQYTGVVKFQKLISIMDILSKSKEYHLLSSLGYKPALSRVGTEHINIAYQYLIDNFREEIKLKEISEKLGMSPSSFCRFFKRKTGKTFSQILNELRIGHACKLIIENDQPILNSCYDSGFNNISYFNRKFKKITTYTPKVYKKQFFGNQV